MTPNTPVIHYHLPNSQFRTVILSVYILMHKTYIDLVLPTKKPAQRRALIQLKLVIQTYAASAAFASASTRARSAAPLAFTSRSTNSTTANGALSPARKPAFIMRI